MNQFFRYDFALNFIGLLLLAYVIVDPFDIFLLFQDTIYTGGDSGSWQQIALHLKESLIPNGRLFGWDQGNFFGYSNLQHYFVLPFFIVVLFSYVIPITIALKCTAVLGIFLLPFIIFIALKKLDYKDPIPLIGSWFSLAFLFHERYSMFGGNLLSTLAGEFCYSIAFVFLVFFFTKLLLDVRRQEISLSGGVFLGLIGLSHAFVFFVAVLMPIYFYFSNPTRQTIRIILVTYGMGFLIMAFWVLSMLSNLDLTTSVIFNWRFNDFQGILYRFHYEIAIAVVICMCTYGFRSYRTIEGGFFIYMMFCSILLYFLASALHIPDIRFLPPLLFFMLLFIVDTLASFLRSQNQYRRVAAMSLVGLSIMFGSIWVYDENNNAANWFKWGFSGYETKPAFKDGRAEKLFNALKGDYSDPRVAWEQGRHEDDFGTARIFENIPLFTGRASTEGIHYASSMFSTLITTLHSEYSLTASSPSPSIYSHYYIDDLPNRFNMLNIRDFIAYTPEITELIKRTGQFNVIGEYPPYTLFSLKNFTSQYIESPKYAPILTKPYEDWKHRFKNWFRRAESLDLTLINGAINSQQVESKFAGIESTDFSPAGVFENISRRPIIPATITNQKITNFEISFNTDKPKTPHVIKISYSPNWKSVNSEAIFMIAPGFMLIYPESNHVTLSYGRHWSEYVGFVLTLIAVLLLLCQKKIKQCIRFDWGVRVVDSAILGLLNYRKLILFVLVILALYSGVYSYNEKNLIYSDYMAGNALVKEKKYREAISFYKNNVTLDKINYIDNVDVPTSMYAMARTYLDMKETEKAKDEFRRLIQYFPRWTYVDEAYWHLGELTHQQGDFEEAKGYYRMCAKIAAIGEQFERCSSKLELSNSSLGIL